MEAPTSTGESRKLFTCPKLDVCSEKSGEDPKLSPLAELQGPGKWKMKAKAEL